MSMPETFKGWPLMEALPAGWRIDKTAGSPLHGYEFVTNGESMLSGRQMRGLLRVFSPEKSPAPAEPRPILAAREEPSRPSSPAEIDPMYARTVNELARQKFKQKILNDVLVDLTICEIEGWNKMEYINEIRELISGIGVRP